MKQRVCKVCGSVMKKQSTDEGFKFFCKKCDAYTEYDEADMEAYCPDCGNKISHVYACCGMSFFCSKCEEQKRGSLIDWRQYA
jgi:DNA-directed RNA polymerase subunit RPC12/RpoP